MCCLTSPAYWNSVLMLAAHCPVATSPCCTAGVISLQLWVLCLEQKAFLHPSKKKPKKLEFPCRACCLLASTSFCFS